MNDLEQTVKVTKTLYEFYITIINPVSCCCTGGGGAAKSVVNGKIGMSVFKNY